MENYLGINTTFWVIPNKFNNIEVFKLEENTGNTLVLSNPEFNSTLNINEEIEVFSGTKDGILYFKTIVKFFKNNMLIIDFPSEFEILQRRESQRISINEKIIIEDNTNPKILAKLLDLSVGGMKISVGNQLLINHDYSVFLDFDNLNLQFIFTPLRMNYDSDSYIISGKLETEKTDDKIKLVQYCYKKLFESSNR